MKRYRNIDPITLERLDDEWEFQAPGICHAIAGVVASVATTAYSASQQKKAANKAAAAQQQGVAEARAYSEEAANQSAEILDPLASLAVPSLKQTQDTSAQYRKLGDEGITALKAQQSPLNVAQFLDPSTAYQLKAGQDAVQSSAAARGGLLSGATLQSLQKSAQGIASTNYNNAVQQATANRAQQLGIADGLQQYGTNATNINKSLLDIGINATGQQANIIAGQGSNNANLSMTSGNIAGAAAAASKDPLASGLTTGLGAATAAGMFSPSPTPVYSDEDLKIIDGPVSDEEIDEFLSKMTATSYDYTDEAKDKGAPAGRQVGIIAQDAEKSKMGKNIVVKDEDGDRMLDVPKTVSALLASSAVLNKRVKKLEGKK